MAAEHRITRKQLLKEPDTLQQVNVRLMNTILQYRVPLLIILGGLVVMAGAIGFIQGNKATRLKEQEALYFKMTQIVEKAPAGDAASTIKALQDQLKDFDEGLPKQRGELLLADSHYRFAQYQEAMALYSQIMASTQPGELNHDLARRGLATSQEASGDHKSAISSYKSIVDSPGSLPVFYIYLGLARSYEATGDIQNAILTLRDIKTKFPNHGDLDQINSRLKRLEAKS